MTNRRSSAGVQVVNADRTEGPAGRRLIASPARPSAQIGSGVLTAGERDAVGANVAASMADNTRAAYTSDWAKFTAWCIDHDHYALPADPWVVASYLTEHAVLTKPDSRPAYAPATLTRWSSSINQVHTAAGHPAPGKSEVVRRALAGIRKHRATPQKRRAPLLVEDLRVILVEMRERAGINGLAAQVRERRDSLLLLLGFAGAFRRSELTGLTIADTTLHRTDGLHIRLRTSKTDKQSRGTVRAAPFGQNHETCVPCAYLRWRQILDAHDHPGDGLNSRATVIRALRNAGPFDQHVCAKATDRKRALPAPTVDAGWGGERPLFRVITRACTLTDRPLTGQTVAYLVKAHGKRAGLPPATVDLLGGHSLRAGFVTQAFRSGADAHAIMRQTGHKSPAMLEIYARENAPLVGNAVTQVGL